MRVPLGLVAIPLVIIGVFGIFLSPAAAMGYLDRFPVVEPLRVRLASVLPLVAGNRSWAVAVSFLLYLVVKQISDFFDKP